MFRFSTMLQSYQVKNDTVYAENAPQTLQPNYNANAAPLMVIPFRSTERSCQRQMSKPIND